MSSIDTVIGIHAVGAVLERQPERIQQLWVAEGRARPALQALIDKAQQLGIRWHYKDKRSLDALSNGNHQGVIAQCKPAKAAANVDLETLVKATDNPLLLVLDGVTDPHNLGACLRTADAAGVTAVILPKDKSVSVNETVRKVACGAAETMPVVTVTNLARTLQHLQEWGVWLVGTSGEAEQSLYELDLSGAIAVVMGAEGSGIRQLTAKTCDYLAYIPMAGYVSSLNVSVATGVCLFEAVRQRKNR